MGFLEVLGTLDFAIWEGERGAEGEMELISCDQSPAGKLGVQWSGARGTREGWFKLNVASSPKVGEQRTNNLGKAGKGTEGYALRYGTRETAGVVLAWFCTQRSLRNTFGLLKMMFQQEMAKDSAYCNYRPLQWPACLVSGVLISTRQCGVSYWLRIAE